MSGHWIQTFSGRKFDLTAPTTEMVCIEDIVHSLSNICRFGGHCRQFYSVLDHSIRVSEIVPPDDRLAALLHDAGEAYYGDITRPQKLVYRDMTKYESRAGTVCPFNWFTGKIDVVIALAFGLADELPPSVKHADNVLLATEARDLMCDPPLPWESLPEPLEWMIEPRSPAMNKHHFMELFLRYAPEDVKKRNLRILNQPSPAE